MQIDPQAHIVVSGALDGELRFWDLQSGAVSVAKVSKLVDVCRNLDLMS